MRQLRIVSDNAADRAVLSVPGTVAGLGASHLQTEIKGQVCRILGSTAAITATWTTEQSVACVVLPACSLSADSTVRVRAFNAAGAQVLDTGERWAAPGATLGHWDFTQPLNANAFAEGAATCQVWFDHVAASRVEISLSDPGAAFIDLARLVIGPYLAPEHGPDFGATLGTTDLAKTSRAASGDLRTDWAPRAATLSFDLNHIVERDRARVRRILEAGVGKWLFVSLCAGDSDPVREQDYSLYGKPTGAGSMSYASALFHNTRMQLEGW